MITLLTRAGCFVAIIILGAVLRKIGFFKEEDFSMLGKISLRITLPAAIVTSFAGKTIDVSLLTIALLGLGMGVLYMVVAYFVNLRNTKEQRAFELLNLSGCNVGAFTIPFLQSFLGSGAVIVASLFDVGNAAIGLGTSYGIALSVRDGKGFSWKRIGKALSRAVALMTYVVMVVLCLLGIRLPQAVLDFASIVGGANTFVAMLMIGVGFKLTANKAQIGKLLKLIVLRYGIGGVLALLFWFMLPFDMAVRQTLVILAFSPIISAAPAFTGELKGDVGLSSAFNSICIVLSIVIYVTLLSAMV